MLRLIVTCASIATLMAPKEEYGRRFDAFRGGTAYDRLQEPERNAIRSLAFAYRFTFQEFRHVVEASSDLALWGQDGLCTWLKPDSEGRVQGAEGKRDLLAMLDRRLAQLKTDPTVYVEGEGVKPPVRERKPVVTRKTEKKIHGMCPVASELTVCCNLRTIDAVERCVFGCSYCAVQTFYDGDIVFDDEFSSKLAAIELDPDRFYHFGTGQSSDSLAWGNRAGILDALCQFATKYPNVLLELKTKSHNIRYFLEHDVPPNVVCSWSLNTPVVIEYEEHLTADLEARIGAARAVADREVKVAFHFHPMVHYRGWETDYPMLARELMARFSPDEVLFVSFGSVTLIKPVIRKLRQLGNPTRIHQSDLVPDPHGKLTYPDDVKVNMFSTMSEAFAPWEDDVFFYLCMEKSAIWERALGRVYASNELFESDFGRRTLSKLVGSELPQGGV